MSGFSVEWLSLRESADHAARSSELTGAIARGLPEGRPIRVTDLAAGTGSNARYLIDRLPAPQEWLLVDHDAALLAQVPSRMRGWAITRGYRLAEDGHRLQLRRADRLMCSIETRAIDLATIEDGSMVDGCDLVTASALLDLVSAPWLSTLAAHCGKQGAAVLFVLSYDGQMRCVPEEPEDEVIRLLVNDHQRTDKGLGRALGPDATTWAAGCFADRGYQVRRASSDWHVPSDSVEFQQQLIDGWARAAREMAPDRTALIDRWQSRRLAHIAAGRSRVVVGHEDLIAWPPSTSPPPER